MPEIADFELRRDLTWPGSKELARLDASPSRATYVPLDTPTMRFAAELWAALCARGKPTEGDEALGGDVILAAQALRVRATVVTDNPRYLGRMVETVACSDV